MEPLGNSLNKSRLDVNWTYYSPITARPDPVRTTDDLSASANQRVEWMILLRLGCYVLKHYSLSFFDFGYYITEYIELLLTNTKNTVHIQFMSFYISNALLMKRYSIKTAIKEHVEHFPHPIISL